MFRSNRAVLSVLVVAALAAFAVPTLAQAPYSEATPTKKEPLRFTAFAVQMQGGRAGVVEVTIERWSTEEERNALIAQVQKTSDKDADQRKLVTALQKIKERCGYLNLPNTMGWDIKYAHEAGLPDGKRQIVIVTDKPVSFGMARSGNADEAPFTLIEMQFPKGSNKGEGKLLASTSISTKDGRLQLETYYNQPTRLTEITEKNPKVKK
jgi:hypothetical protein